MDKSPAPPGAPFGTCALGHEPPTRPSNFGGCLRCIVGFVGGDGDTASDPVWDPLRSDPRFAALVEKLAPKPVR